MKQIYKRFIWISASFVTLSVIVVFSRAQDNGSIMPEQPAEFLGDAGMIGDEEAALLSGEDILLFVLPDLKVHSVGAPSSASRGSSIAVSDVTTNVGTANAQQSTSKIYISPDLNNVGNVVTSHTVAGIAIGKSWSWSGSVTVPASQTLGTNYFVVVANANHLVNELDYNNNTNYVLIIINP